MREPGLGGFLVVLAEIARSMKKLLGNNWRLQANFIGSIEDGLTARPRERVVMQRVI